jgi:hypothetical protein
VAVVPERSAFSEAATYLNRSPLHLMSFYSCRRPRERHDPTATQRRGWDSNPRNGLPLGRFQGACTSPLCDLARRGLLRSRAREHPDPSPHLPRPMTRCGA